jgi:DNA-directed RNA polymerase subunit RPC12/RpoP
MGLIKCPKCGKDISNNEKSCPYCSEIIDTTMRCPHCGSPYIKVISPIRKAISYAFWGSMDEVSDKKYMCNKCGHKFI